MRTRAPQRRLRPNDRGSLLVVTLIILIVLAGIAAIAVRNVMVENQRLGNYRVAEQALRISESGMVSVMALAVDKGDAFPVFVQANQNKLSMSDASADYFDTSATGSFGREFANIGGVDFQSELTAPVDTNRVPGFPVSEQFVWKKYRVVTTGSYGDQSSTTLGDQLRSSERRFVSFVFVGPFFVGGN